MTPVLALWRRLRDASPVLARTGLFHAALALLALALMPFDDHVAVPEGRVSSSNVVLEIVSTSSLASARTVMSTSSPRSTDVGLI